KARAKRPMPLRFRAQVLRTVACAQAVTTASHVTTTSDDTRFRASSARKHRFLRIARSSSRAAAFYVLALPACRACIFPFLTQRREDAKAQRRFGSCSQTRAHVIALPLTPVPRKQSSLCVSAPLRLCVFAFIFITPLGHGLM